MSTEHQQYSLENQAEVIRQYADANNFVVVRTYSDAARSGLDLHHRSGLKALLQDVAAHNAPFSAILVYDVSRWGRFQDADEGAHYEFVCRKAGVPVYYCAEQFANDGRMSSRILKALKRAAAAEYSRELSVKVFDGKHRLASLGFRMGGPVGYGLQRVLMRGGEQIATLRDGERKAVASDHVVLVPGCAAEVKIVRLMYERALAGQLPAHIASELNALGIRNVTGGAWRCDSVLSILRSRKYAGCNVWAQTSQKLKSPSIPTDPSTWAVRVDCFVPVVPRATFDRVQHILEQRKRRSPGPTRRSSNDDLLTALKHLLQEQGFLSRALIVESPDMPSATTYGTHFGSVQNAFRRIGYVQPRLSLKQIRGCIVERIRRQCPGERIESIERDRSTELVLDGVIKVAIRLALHGRHEGHCSWSLNSVRNNDERFTLLVLLDRSNQYAEAYYLLPSLVNFPRAFGELQLHLLGDSRLTDLSTFVSTARALIATTEARS